MHSQAREESACIERTGGFPPSNENWCMRIRCASSIPQSDRCILKKRFIHALCGRLFRDEVQVLLDPRNSGPGLRLAFEDFGELEKRRQSLQSRPQYNGAEIPDRLGIEPEFTPRGGDS